MKIPSWNGIFQQFLRESPKLHNKFSQHSLSKPEWDTGYLSWSIFDNTGLHNRDSSTTQEIFYMLSHTFFILKSAFVLQQRSNSRCIKSKWIVLIQAQLATRINSQVSLPSISDIFKKTVCPAMKCSLGLSSISHLVLLKCDCCSHFLFMSQNTLQIVS